MYIAVFLFWNDYPKKNERFILITSLKLIGHVILVFLVLKFRSGKPENDGYLITG